MVKIRPTLFVIVAVLALIGIEVFRYVATSVDDSNTRRQLAEAASLDAKLTAEMLRVRSGLTPHFDEIVRVEAELRKTVRALDDDKNFAAVVAAQPGFKELLEQLKKKLDSKHEKLDTIKLKRAIVSNSSKYLPRALDKLDAENPAAAEDFRRRALAVSLRSVTSRPDSDGSKPEGLMGDVKKHIDHIQEKMAGLETSTREFLAEDTAAIIAELARVYDLHREEARREQGTARVALTAFSMFLLGAILVIGRQLTKTYLALARTNAQLALTHQAAQKFVPQQFLLALGKPSITEVKRGDAVKKRMTILFSDIREFTAISQTRSPEQNFNFMNEFHGRMEEPIHAHHGFVNEYRGDGMMALFPERPDDALEAAVKMFAALDAWAPEGRPVRIGVGVNCGPLMLGTFGSESRLNAGVIANDVNIASRMESLTKEYGVRVIVSQAAFEQLADASRFRLRRIDRVEVKGSTQPQDIYELLDAEAPDLRRKKIEQKSRHEEALTEFFHRHFPEARALFEKNLEALPEDEVSRLFISRCQAYEAKMPPADWNGVTKRVTK